MDDNINASAQHPRSPFLHSDVGRQFAARRLVFVLEKG